MELKRACRAAVLCGIAIAGGLVGFGLTSAYLSMTRPAKGH